MTVPIIGHVVVLGYLATIAFAGIENAVIVGELDANVMLGRIDDARQLFERLLLLRNDVELLSEEYDPIARRLLGNFPQALSHIALANFAFNLREAVEPAMQRSESR